jgi:Spy/CpxP family protein refolding chaperone
MAKWKIWVALLVLFVSGVLIGSVGTRMYVRHKLSGIFSRERPPIQNMFVRRLTREIDLTREQRQEIEQVASRAAEKFHELRSEHRSQAEALFDQSASEIKKHLSPEQQEQFDELRKRMRARHKRGRRGPPHGGHPPPPPLPPSEPPPP